MINSEIPLEMLCYVFINYKITNGIFNCLNLAHNYNRLRERIVQVGRDVPEWLPGRP